MKTDTPQRLSTAVQTEINAFNQWKRETESLESRLQSSTTRLGELRTEISQLEYEKETAVKARRKTADQLATGEIDESEFTETRRKHAELSERIDEAVDLQEAFERAIDGLQGKFNDARAHTHIARVKANRAYCAQIQGEIKEKCGDLLMLGLAAKFAGGSQTGVQASGYFLHGALTGNEVMHPEFEEILRLKTEIEKRLGIDE